MQWWNWHAAQTSAELSGRARCLFPEGQAFCVEKLLARWDRRVNCRSITPPSPSSLSTHITPFSIVISFILDILFSSTLVLFLFYAAISASSLSTYRLYSKPHSLCCLYLIHPLSMRLTHSVSPSVCEISGVTVGTVCDLWLTRSEPLSGAGKALCAAACVWMTMENQSHYAQQPCPSHSRHCRLHLAPWFMDAILAPERDMKGSLEVWGYICCGFQGQHLHSAKHDFEENLTDVFFICIHAYV